MSAASIAKAAQGYEPKPVSSTCVNCAHFHLDRILPTWMAAENGMYKREKWGNAHAIEKNLRCTLGGFAVRKSGTCRELRLKVAP